jgi:hypothetical protein
MTKAFSSEDNNLSNWFDSRCSMLTSCGQHLYLIGYSHQWKRDNSRMYAKKWVLVPASTTVWETFSIEELPSRLPYSVGLAA